MKELELTTKNRFVSILITLLLLILCLLILMALPAGKIFPLPSNAATQSYNPSGDSLSNAYVCSHYFSRLAEEMDCSETPFQTGEYESFTPGLSATLRHPLALYASGGGQDAIMLKQNFVSSGIYLPLEMETTEGTVVIYTIVAYWLTSEGELKEDLVALGVELPDGEERFFLDDPEVDGLQAARAFMKSGVVFTATLTGFVSQHGVDWAGCPSSDFANQFGEQTCLVGAALAEGNPPDVSSGFTGSFLFGWKLNKSQETVTFPICQYIEES